MAQPEGGGGKLGGDPGVDGGPVAAPRRDPVGTRPSGPEQRGEEFVISHMLQLGDHHPAGMLEKLLVGPVGMLGCRCCGDTVVLADEERLEGKELGILVGPDVTGEEELGIGHDVGVVGVGEAGGVEGEQPAGARQHPSADMLAEGGIAGGIDSIDL